MNGRKFSPLPIASRKTRIVERKVLCPKGHDFLIDVPESVILETNGERMVPENVTGVWGAWCETCHDVSWCEKERGELLVVKGERRDIPTRPPEPDSRLTL